MLIDKNKLRVNPNYYVSPDDGTVYTDLSDPALRKQFGITEIPDPVPPNDIAEEVAAHPDWYFIQPCDPAPYCTWTKRHDVELIELGKVAKIAQAHLDETDYLFSVDRLEEMRVEEPEREAALRASRADARQKVRAYKVALKAAEEATA